MPKTIGELINDLAQKAGVAVDDAKLKALLASPELATITVDDALYNTIDSSLLSIESAKNNHPDIAAVYNSQFYDTWDKALVKIIADAEFSPEDIAEIKAVPKTRERYALAITKLKEQKSKATGADKDAINAQLAGAHEAARLAKLEVTTVRTEMEGKIKDIQQKAAIKAVFGNYKTIYDELPAAVRTATMEAIIMQGLQDKNAELRTDEQGNLQLVSKDGSSNVFGANHVQLTPQSFLDQTLAPILKVSDRTNGQPQPPRQQPKVPATSPAEHYAEATNDFVKSHTEQVLADMAKPAATLI